MRRLGAGVAFLALQACQAGGVSADDTDMIQLPILGGEAAGHGAWRSVLWLSSGCSATLIHESVIVYAAHCGDEHEFAYVGGDFNAHYDSDSDVITFDTDSAEKVVPLSRCVAYPGAELGTGTDVAFCELAEPLEDVPAILPAFGCELDVVSAGAEATLVGFGLEEVGAERFGAKRIAHAVPIKYVGAELVIGSGDAGTCRGDSGGPAFVRVPSESVDDEWRIAAVMSSGRVGECGVGYYTNLWQHVGWLEEESGYDLTPCFDLGGNWSASPECLRPALDVDGTASAYEAGLSDTCGDPYRPPDSVALEGCQIVRLGGGHGGVGSGWVVLMMLACAPLAFTRRRLFS